MKFLVFISLCLPLAASAQVAGEVPFLSNEYDPVKWPKVELRLSRAGTVKDFFDAGLRPYRFPALETSKLEVKHLNLVIHLASGKTLPSIPTQWLNITPFADGAIASFYGCTPQLNLEQARGEMLQWLPYGANGRTVEDLDAYLRAVAADYLDFDDPDRGIPHGCGIGWKEPEWGRKDGGAHCGIGFKKSLSASHPLSLHFNFSWSSNRPSKERRKYTIPIPPPPGYEDVSMAAPRNIGPDSLVEILRSKGVDVGDGKGGIPYEQYLASTNLGTTPSAPQPPPSVPTAAPAIAANRPVWLLWLSLGAGALFLLIRALRRRLPPP